MIGIVVMPTHSDDYRQLMAQQKFLQDIEQGIRIANREIIHERLPTIPEDMVLKFAVTVSRFRADKFRADYLESAFKMISEGGSLPSAEVLTELSDRREAYLLARNAFDALQKAIERGYVDLEL